MYTNSVPALISKNVGNSLSNYRTWGNIIFNVKEYGAKGNGSTDDTAAISAALTAAVKGGEIFFPPGDYVYSHFFSPPSNVTFSGIKGVSRLIMKPNVLPTFGFFNVGSVSNVMVSNLSFIGNAVAPTISGAAEVAFFMLNCSNILFRDCYFTGYMGLGIAFQGGLDTHVINCKFESMGQLQIGLTPKKSVPAVWAAYDNKGLKVINCIFEDCRWAGVYMLGVDGIAAYCRMNNIGETGIYSENWDEHPTNNNQALNNRISNVYQVDVTACGIEWSTSNSLLQGNIIDLCAADGIAIGVCNNTTVATNTCYNNNVGNTLGGRGIGVNNKGGVSLSTTGVGIKIIGNTCYDDRAVKLQLWGIQVQALFSGTNFFNSVVSNNILYGNTSIGQLDIVAGVFDDPTNLISNNNGWLDVIKSTNSTNTTSALTQTLLKSAVIRPNSMSTSGGIRITAWGSVTGTTGFKYVTLKFDTGTGEFCSVVFSAAQNGKWRIEAFVENQNNASVQNLSAITYRDTAVYGQFNSAGTVDTTIVKAVALYGQVDNALDSVICNGLVVERM